MSIIKETLEKLEKFNEQKECKYDINTKGWTDEEIDIINSLDLPTKRIYAGDYKIALIRRYHNKFCSVLFNFKDKQYYLRNTYGQEEHIIKLETFDIFKDMEALHKFVEPIVLDGEYFKKQYNETVAYRYVPLFKDGMYRSKDGTYLYIAELDSFVADPRKVAAQDGKTYLEYGGYEVDTSTEDKVFNAIQKASKDKVLKYEKVHSGSQGDVYEVKLRFTDGSRAYLVNGDKAKSISLTTLLAILKQG